MVEGTFHILMDDFDIRQGSLSCWVPVDDVFATVEQVLLIEGYENLLNGF